MTAPDQDGNVSVDPSELEPQDPARDPAAYEPAPQDAGEDPATDEQEGGAG